MGFLRTLGRFIGRLLVGGVFVAYAVNTLMNWDTIAEVLEAKGFTMIPLALSLTMGLAVLGGICLIFGVKVKLGALCLLLVTAVVTCVKHDFWLMEDPERMENMLAFLKNAVIFGGLLLVFSSEN